MKLLFLFLLPLSVLAQLSSIRIQGNSFVNEKGDTLVFHGLNSSDPDKLEKEGHWNLEYFAEMRKWGANCVRFPIHPRAWRTRGEEAYCKLLDEGIKLAEQVGLYVILDWHSIGNLRMEMFFKEGYKTSKPETYAFWGAMASRYKDNSTVLGYELFNEPTTINGKLGSCSWQQWKEIQEEIIGIIRAHGDHKPVLVAGFNWGYDLTEVARNPINDSQVAYVSHPYPQKREKPWESKWEADWGFVSKKYPVVLTEVGFCGPEDKGAHVPVISDESYGETLLAYTKERGISYVVWVFDPEWSPMLFSDWDFTPTRQGRFFKGKL